MRGSIVKREGKRGPSYFVVLRGRWYRCPQATKRAAELYRAQLITDIERGLMGAQEDVDLATFSHRWLAARAPEISLHSVDAYESVLRTMILPHLGQRSLPTLSPEDCDQWRAIVLQSYGAATVTRAIAVLKMILATAVKWRVIRQSPAAGLKRPRAAKSEALALTAAQVAEVLRVTVAPDHRAMVMLAVTGGLRVGEIAAARWEHLDLEARTYHVKATAWDNHGSRVAPPKTRGSAAKVSLSPSCCEALVSHRAAQAELLLAKQWRDEGYMFLGATGRRVRPKTLEALWGRIAAHAGLPPMGMHALRHTCASLLIDGGANVKVIQTQMRHATIQMTFDVYGHLMPGRVGEAVAQLDQTIGAV